MSKKRYTITAIIYDKKGNVISVGYNNYTKTHPLQAKYACKVGLYDKIFIHAEVDAIAKAGWRIKKAYKIKILRYDSEGNPKCAKPCPVCQELIKHTPIKIIRHT